MNGKIAFVIIGRNEGDRLKRCLLSAQKESEKIVYVDSGSTDGSIEAAAALGIDVLNLDTSMPFSAGRARNEGFFHIVNAHQNIDYVQFIDGDCELFPQWTTRAFNYLEENTAYTIVTGQRKERFPKETIYNLICHIEWNTPVGDTDACGGDFMVRSTAFSHVGGFNPSVIAGEEPDLCYRLRKEGGKIFRIDEDMTLHDSAMTRFSQWWKRALRAGHAYSQGFDLHKAEKTGYYKREVMRIIFWSYIFPLFCIVSAIFYPWLILLLPLGFSYKILKILSHSRKKGMDYRTSAIYSLFIGISNFPESMGFLKFYTRKLFKKEVKIIEHK